MLTIQESIKSPMPITSSNATAADLANKTASNNSLNQVLDHSERVQDILAECADDLSVVNDALKQELALEQLPQAVEQALNQNDVVETKVETAAIELSVVNEALQDEIDARLALEIQLAAAIKEKEQAHHAAMHDALTGLANRALFHKRLECALAQAVQIDYRPAVLFIDLDKFKILNDTHGHASGDQMLQVIADALKSLVGAVDTISRYGGDEFLALLTHAENRQTVENLADKMTRAIESAAIEYEPAQFLRISASVGIALYPADGATAHALIDAADKAMYRIKQEKSVIAADNI